MLLIIAHHYTVNSGLTELYDFNNITGNMIFLQIFGMWGKTVINCFTLITGYFMVKSNVSVKKFLKLYLEVKFYYLFFYLMFIITGYEPLTVRGLIKTLFNIVYEAGDSYTGTYILFYLFIPFLNILATRLNKQQHQALLILLLSYFTVFSTFFKHDTFDFLGWMMTMYFVGGYIRLHTNKYFESRKVAAAGLVVSVTLMIVSILVVDFVGCRIGFTGYDYMVSDSHKFLALTCSVSAFLLFKNISMKQSRLINAVAASTFGILLIHANSAAMRRFLWSDVFNNTNYYSSSLLPLHAVGAVVITYLAGYFIDRMRIKLIEKPFMRKMSETEWLIKLEKRMGDFYDKLLLKR